MIEIILMIIASLSFTACSIPQIIKTHKMQSAKDVSVSAFFLMLLGVTSVLILSFITENSWWIRIQQIANFISSFALTLYVLKFKLREIRESGGW